MSITPDSAVEHLSPDTVAAFLEGRASGEERARAVAHFARCAACREELREVDRMVRHGRRRRLAMLVPLAAAAGALFFLWPSQAPPGEAPGIERSRATAARLAVVAPTASAEVAVDSVVFTWRSAGVGANYRVTVATEDGSTVWTGTTGDTTVSLPDSVTLAPSRTWFWYVDALFPDGRSTSTGIQRLRTQR